MVLRFFLAVIAALPATFAFAAPLSGYKGPDAGQVVLSVAIGSIPAGTWAVIHYRRTGGPDGDALNANNSSLTGHYDAVLPTFDEKTTAFVEKNGVAARLKKNFWTVYVVALAPGDYEIDSIRVNSRPLSAPTGEMWQTFDRGVVPFHVDAGRATYVGSIAVVTREQPAPLGVVYQGWLTILSDQGERDLAVAAKRMGALEPVERAHVLDTLGDGAVMIEQ